MIMKSTLLFLLGILIFFPIKLNAQVVAEEEQPYKVWVKLMDGTKVKGILYSANERGVKIMNIASLDVSNLTSIESNSINLISLRRKGKVGKGVWVGGLTGASTGILLGIMSGDDDAGFINFSKEDKAIVGGITLGVLGTGVGALIATGKNKIRINGNNDMFEKQVDVIKNYSLMDD